MRYSTSVTDDGGKCVVMSVRSYVIFKSVCFRAQQECSFSRLMLRLGDRAKFPIIRHYSLSTGSMACLPYPFWRPIKQGQVVSFGSLAMHPLADWKGLRA